MCFGADREPPGSPTVCQRTGCSHTDSCWSNGQAAFVVGGEYCTRHCLFCPANTGAPPPLDGDEPRRLAASARQMGLNYITITGVTRDDLPDAGAWLFAQSVREVRRACPWAGIEIMVPDFDGEPWLVDEVIQAAPQVFGHSVWTVPRLYETIRPECDYGRSLRVLAKAAMAGLVTKSSLVLGLGERPNEVAAVLADLRAVGCELVTISQYTRPASHLHPVERWITSAEFSELAVQATALGFSGVMSGASVRASYQAGQLWAWAMAAGSRPIPAELAGLAAALTR